MKNSDLNLSVYTTQYSVLNYPGLAPNTSSNYYALWVVNRDDDFTFTGFGSNDKKRRWAPTAGTYAITEGDRYALLESAGHKVRLYKDNWNPNWALSAGMVSSGICNYTAGSGSKVTLAPSEFDTGLKTVIYNNALTKLYDDIRSSELNALLTIGERKESAKLISKAVSAAGSLVTTARSIRRQMLTNPSLLFSNLWLAGKYGVLPLYNDVYSALNWHFHVFQEMRVKAKAARTVEKQTYTSTPWHPVILNDWVHGERCYVHVDVGIANSDAYNLSRVTSLNPLTIAWELTPFSFVYDWVHDVGGYLALMEASFATGLSFKSGCKTQVTYRSHKVNGRPYYKTVDSYQGGGLYFRDIWSFPRLYGYQLKVNKDRTILGGFPRPNFPTFRPNLGSQRIISAASLLRQVVLGAVKGGRW